MFGLSMLSDKFSEKKQKNILAGYSADVDIPLVYDLL